MAKAGNEPGTSCASKWGIVYIVLGICWKDAGMGLKGFHWPVASSEVTEASNNHSNGL